ncbi:hypothetical protein Tco_1163303 [Tanacetum coccineum]
MAETTTSDGGEKFSGAVGYYRRELLRKMETEIVSAPIVDSSIWFWWFSQIYSDHRRKKKVWVVFDATREGESPYASR